MLKKQQRIGLIVYIYISKKAENKSIEKCTDRAICSGIRRNLFVVIEYSRERDKHWKIRNAQRNSKLDKLHFDTHEKTTTQSIPL